MFSKETYQDRRAELKKNVSKGVLLFLGNIENPMNFADNTFPFRQDSSFLYYFGIQTPGLGGIIDLEEDKTILFGDELTMDDLVWMGSQESLASKAEKSGVTETRSFEKLFSYVAEAVGGDRNVHFLPPYQPDNKIKLSHLFHTEIADLEPSVEFIKAVVAQRSIKEDREIREIEKAVNITNRMHLKAMEVAKPGMKEYQIVSAIEKLAGDEDCRFSYPPIMTVNGEILHNHYRGNTLQSGQMVLNDSGIELPNRYPADLTRTFPVDKKFSPEQRDLYNIVLKAFEESQAIMKPGLNYKLVHRKACEVLAEGLIDMGLLKGNPKDAVENNAHTLFFQCGVGHLMGLDIHDMEDMGEQYVGYTEDNPKDNETFGWKSLRLGKPLEKGNVVTVEPGFYPNMQLLEMWRKDNKCADFVNYDKVEEFRDFGGIRIEDNFLITENGYELIGDGLIKTAEDVENYRAEHLS